MLSLQLQSGEYIKIGDDIVVQAFRESGGRIRIHIRAPRELRVLRGTLSERSGEARPLGLIQGK